MKKIAFVWQGVSDPLVRAHWNDGLSAAMTILEKEYEVTYHEPTEHIQDKDLILYWEAPCTCAGKDREKYRNIQYSSIPSILLFAGGPIKPEWVEGFQRIIIESEHNIQEFNDIGIDVGRAFGINENIFKPEKMEKEYDAIFHGTWAGWKRQDLFAKTFGKRGIAIGQLQEGDRDGYTACVQLGVHTFAHMNREDIVDYINKSVVCVNTCDYWGGGQRTTLEAMACGIPVIVMKDSPKNCEYIINSGGGAISDPEPERIREKFNEVVANYDNMSLNAIDYVKNNWTSVHYAAALKEEIDKLLN